MKRWIGSLVLSGLAGAALAQAPFTIVRPADGSRVREKVHILIPKGSIPPGGYVGVFLNGKLIEAVVPPLNGKYYDYVLDTKGRGIPDTPAGKTDKIEVVLYTDYQDRSRVVDRSSIDVKVGNQANIPIPNSGVKLRYHFVPGQEMVYNLEQRVSISQQSEEQSKLGARAATTDAEGERIRLSYSVVNSYGNGDGLLRLQALPEKGKDYADLTPSGEAEAKRWYDTDMAPIYMRVSSTGHEVFGSLPPYVPLEGSAGSGGGTALYAAFPLPTLPAKAVNVGDSWPSRFQEGAIDISRWYDLNSVVDQFPARGEFVNVEWERGHPCARIQNILEAGTESLAARRQREQAQKAAGSADAGAKPISNDKVGVKETIWFALDTHQILKIQREMTIDRRIDTPSSPSGGFGGPGGFGPGGGGRPGPAGGFGPAGGGKSAADVTGPVTVHQRGRQGGPGFGPPGSGPGFGPAGAPGGPFGSGRNGAGSQRSSATYIRTQVIQTFTLER